LLSPAIAQRTGINKSVSFARWQQGRGLLCLAPQLVLVVDAIVVVVVVVVVVGCRCCGCCFCRCCCNSRSNSVLFYCHVTRLQEELFRDNLTRLYGMKDELEKTYRSQIDLVHSRYRGTRTASTVLWRWYVCMLHRTSNCSNGRIMRRGIISSCQSAATSEIVKRF